MAGALHQIMLPVRGDGKDDNVFAHAAVVAKRSGAYVEVIHCRPRAQDLMSYGVVVPNSLHKQVDAVQHHGCLSDLICVPKRDRSSNLGFNTLKSTLFTSARPITLCPEVDDVPPDLGRHVTIGWNGSLEATRALATGLPWIEAAEQVTILTTGTEPHATTAEDLQAYLGVRGVTATVNRFEKDGSIGRRLLQIAQDVGANLLLMGAYQDSYEREPIFGGNTQAVVEDTRIPVVRVH